MLSRGAALPVVVVAWLPAAWYLCSYGFVPAKASAPCLWLEIPIRTSTNMGAAAKVALYPSYTDEQVDEIKG